MNISIGKVTNMHKKKCEHCGKIPKHIRYDLVCGRNFSQEHLVFCNKTHLINYFKQKVDEAKFW